MTAGTIRPDMPPQVSLTVRITPEMHDVLRLYSYVFKVSINETVTEAIRQMFGAEADPGFVDGMKQFLDRYDLMIDSTTGGAIMDRATGKDPSGFDVKR